MNFLASRTMPIVPPEAIMKPQVAPPQNQILPGLRAGLNRGTATDVFKGAPNAKQNIPRETLGRKIPQEAFDFGGAMSGAGALPMTPEMQQYMMQNPNFQPVL